MRVITFREYVTLNEVTVAGGQYIDPKRFEKDLVRAVNGVKGYSHFQSRTAESLAHKIVVNLNALGIRGEATLLSGRNPSSNLSDHYRQYGVKNGEPKADLKIGEMRCSVKYAKNAPIATAEANEARAVFSAACQHHPKYQQLVVQQLVPLIQHTMSASMFQKLRTEYDAANPTAFQTMLSRVLGLHSNQRVANAQERTAFQQFLSSTGVMLPIRSELAKFLQSSDTKRAVFHEFASGRHRFSNPELSATHMLVWDETARVSCTPIEQYIASHLQNFTYSIRSAHRAAALRIDVRESLDLPVDILTLCDTWARQEQQRLPLEEHLLGELWSQFIAAVKRVLTYIIELFQRGIDTVMTTFGYEIEGLSWQPIF